MTTEATAVDTLQNQFSGYGSTAQVVARCLDRLALKEPLEKWPNETIEAVVNAFTDEKFPTVIALNKIDHPDADKVFPQPMDLKLDNSPQRIALIMLNTEYC
jgi:ribosome-binding ATPase YchF (GTP1/OBG family)